MQSEAILKYFRGFAADTEADYQPVKAEVLCGADSFRKLGDEWADLCAEAGNDEAFSRPEWFEAFSDAFPGTVILVTARSAGRLVAVLPLTISTGSLHGVRASTLSAIFNLQSPRFDLAHVEDDSLRRPVAEALWKAVLSIKGWQVLEFRLVPRGSWLEEMLAVANAEGYRTGIWEMDAAPYLALPTSGDPASNTAAFRAGLKRHFRYELKRRLKRLQEIGTVEFTRLDEYQPEAMDRYLELEFRSWKGREGTAAACDRGRVDLHHGFARRAGLLGAIRFYELRLDGLPIAIAVNVRFGSKTFFWKTSFDENYGRYSPGNLLIDHFVADSIAMGSDEIDMLSPATEYKKAWASGEREHSALYVFQRNLYGRILERWKFGVIAFLRRYKNSYGGSYGKSAV